MFNLTNAHDTTAVNTLLLYIGIRLFIFYERFQKILGLKFKIIHFHKNKNRIHRKYLLNEII